MNDSAPKYQQLASELGVWFEGQNEWPTKKAFAAHLGIAYSSVKDYFRGRAFPKADAARKLYGVTGIGCLAPSTEPSLFSDEHGLEPAGTSEPSKAGDEPKADLAVGEDAGHTPPSGSGREASEGRLVSTGEVDESPHKTVRIAVSGDVTLRRLEVELVDTREFQRLRSIKQLGTSYLVYPSATHTRFEHSLGTLFEASSILRHITDNPQSEEHEKKVSPEDERLIRLAALLHDVTHIPFGHTLEDETRVISLRHDEDPDRWKRLVYESPIGSKLMAVIGKEGLDELTRIREAKGEKVPDLKERAYIADVVNNTLCADLLDYLKRDVYFCNIQGGLGDRFLKYLFLQDQYGDGVMGVDQRSKVRRLMVRLSKKEAPRHRRDVLSELVDLLRIRYSLGEKVYFHHAKASSSAMMGRAVWSAMHPEPGTGAPLTLNELYEMGDDQLLARLEGLRDPVAKKLARKLLRRDLHKWAYTLTRDESDAAPMVGCNWTQKMVDDFHANPANRTAAEDQLADLCGLEPGDVLIYCPDLDMGKKYAGMLVEWKGECRQLQYVDDPATRPALTAILESHTQLWGLHVFVVRSGKEDAKKWQKLRGFCSWKFAPAPLPQDRDRQLADVLRMSVNERMGRTGFADQADKVVEMLVSKHRSSSDGISSGGELTSRDIDNAIHEVSGDQP